MDLETAQITTTAKLPTLKQGEYDMWRLRIKKYFLVQDYALWDVIENGNSFKPAAKTTINADGTSTTLIPGLVTTEEKVQKKNDTKAKSMLLMALPNEHLMTFNQYKDAKTLFAAIQTRFGGFRRLNKPDLDTISFDDIYNNFKIVEQEVKGTASSSSSSQNMAFVSSPSNTNEVNTAYGFSTTNTQVSTASTQDHKQIHEDDIEEIDLKWQLALLSMRTRRRPRNQDNRNMNQESSRRTVNVEEISSKAMLAIDGAGFDWSYMANDEVLTNMALMAFSDSEFEKLKQEKESNRLQIENFDNASKILDKLIGSQIPNKSKKGLGFVSYNDVPPPPTRLFSPSNLDLSNSGLEEFQQPEFEGYGPKTSKNINEDTSNEVRESPDTPMVEKLVTDDKLERKTVFPTIAKIEFVRAKQQEKPVRKPVRYAEMYRSQSPRGNQRN
ncbi:hypothetical protein Tco_1085425 [Tanacetum coccineum]